MRAATMSCRGAVVAACAGLAMLAGCAKAPSGVDAGVSIDAGELRGVVENGVASFKGIPFAAPPTGANRWRAPQPAAAWEGVRDAASYGADCAQEPFPGDAAPLGETPAEDCLYLNVWTGADARAGENRPVMVWIYGGGFVNGGASPAVYDGSQFAREGVVLVSFNYRLGNFGFFAHPALSAEQAGQPLANYAFMDQICALEWVKRNVAAFGGDPGNVTIFGESAGGMSVHALMTAAPARGLFHKAIIQSGGGRAGLRERPVSGGEESAESRGMAFAAKFGIEGTDAAALEKLRAIPAEQVVGGLNMMTMGQDAIYVGGPVVDGTLMRGGPLDLYAAGEGARVPVMVGATSADIGFVAARDFSELYALYGARADEARELYNPDGNAVFGAAAFKAGGDQFMVEPARAVAQALSAQGQPVYAFRFSYVAESVRSQWPGAQHATEIPYVFDTVAARYGDDLAPADAQAARAAIAYWTSFARTGVPVAEGQPEWPRYDAQTDLILDFTNEGPVAGPDPWKRRLDLAQSLHAETG